jgi:spermidine/putrescine transport system permease protein
MQINSLPMINADIITGVSLCLLFVFLGGLFRFSLGFGTLLIAHITFCIPYVILLITPKLMQLDANLIDAACDLGCTWFQAFRKVVIPEIMPGIINGLIVAFTLSIDDFVISFFTAGGGVMTLPMRIFAMTRRRISPEINALSTILFLSVLILLIIINIKECRPNL